MAHKSSKMKYQIVKIAQCGVGKLFGEINSPTYSKTVK